MRAAALWHAYRTRTDGVPAAPTLWTGPEPAPHPRWPVLTRTGRLYADELAAPTTLAEWTQRANSGAQAARAAGSCAYDTGLCACHAGPGCKASQVSA